MDVKDFLRRMAPMDLKLQGERVVVIGGGRGIGLAIARAFQSEGCRVTLVDRDEAALHAADLPDCDRFPVDATDFEAMQKVASQAPDAKHLVYAAGAGSGKFGFPFWNLEPADWDRVWQINLMGAVHMAHAFAPQLIARPGGTLLFLSSVAAQVGSPTDPPYSAAKAALINFMQVTARDLAPYGVRSNALAPGMVKTDLNRSVWEAGQQRLPESDREDYETWAERKIRQIAPLGKWQTPEEYGAMAVYLASPHACNITGQTINIDGGQVMHS